MNTNLHGQGILKLVEQSLKKKCENFSNLSLLSRNTITFLSPILVRSRNIFHGEVHGMEDFHTKAFSGLKNEVACC